MYKQAIIHTILLVGVSSAANAQNGNSVLTLNQAIEMALNSAPEIKKAKASLGAQTERRRGAWTNVGPKASLEYNQVYFDEKISTQFGPNEILIRDDLIKTGSLTVVQPLTGAFALAELARMEGAKENLKKEGLEISRRDVGFNVAQAYLQAQRAQRMLDITTAAISAVKSQKKDAEALVRAGRINRGDLLKLTLAVSETEASNAKALAGKEIAFLSLGEMIGLPIGTIPEIQPFDATTIKATYQLPSPEEAIGQAISRSPEMRQAELGQSIAEFGKKVTYSKFSPSVSLFAKWDKNFGEVSFGGSDKNQSYGIQIKWDLWNNGTDVFTTREAMDRVQEAQATKTLAQKGLRLVVYQALAMLKASKKSLLLSKAAVAQAEEAYRIEQAKFRSGKSSATELILAETARTASKGRIVAAHTDFKINHLRLQKAMGAMSPSLAEKRK